MSKLNSRTKRSKKKGGLTSRWRVNFREFVERVQRNHDKLNLYVITPDGREWGPYSQKGLIAQQWRWKKTGFRIMNAYGDEILEIAAKEN